MGNCVPKSSSGGAGGGGEGGGVILAGLQTMQRRRTDEAAVAPSSSVVKVKMVLTKGELGWLVTRLKSGDRRLEDVLHEMMARKKQREDGGGWRPSLESIVECPGAETTPAAADS